MTSASSVPTHLLPPLPTAAIPIPPPGAGTGQANSNGPPLNPRPSLPTLPPTSAPPPPSTAGKKGTSMSLSTNVSDLLLSSLLPPNLPKLPLAGGKRGVGAPRELSTQREALSLPLVSNNFRRFVTRVGPVFWLQDRIEEILFWRKPIWTWAWMMTWTTICAWASFTYRDSANLVALPRYSYVKAHDCTSWSVLVAGFQPRALLLLPSLVLILILLHTHERTSPRPSLLGISIPPSSATGRINPRTPSSPNTNRTASSTSTSGGFTATTTEDAEGKTVGVPAVPPKEVESGVDYYMNLQAIQNLMGLISDGYDYIAPRLAVLQSPNPPSSPLSLPLTPTHLMLLLLPPTILLPLTPVQLIPYLLLPLGLAPPLLFHPNLTPWLLGLPSHPPVRQVRSTVEWLLLTDSLSDEVGRKQLGMVEVWENERLDPKLASAQGVQVIPPGGWGSKHLRPSDRSPWVKVASIDTKWKTTEDGLPSGSSTSSTAAAGTSGEDKDKVVLALKSGWEWIPGEDWRVDVCGLWSDAGLDEEGWVYSDDSWQNPAPTPYTEAESGTERDKGGGNMPGLALRRVTRRRRWCRRVYEVDEVKSGLGSAVSV